jgi:tetratricopeptide (TPR) repeat protein
MRIWNKLLFILFGILLSLLVLEAGLQTCSLAYSMHKNYRNETSLRKNERPYKILCLGESTTDGQYPKFLEEILNSRNLGISFSVIDKGHTGTFTDLILLNLESYIKRYNPDMVVTMMGVNDKRRDVVVLANAADRFYARLKTYKLAKSLKFHINVKYNILKNKCFNSSNQAVIKSQFGVSDTCSASVYNADNNFSNKFHEYLSAAKIFSGQGLMAEAERMFFKAISVNPKNDQAYVELANFYLYRKQGPFKEAENMYLKAISINPKNDRACVPLASLYKQLGKYEEARSVYIKLLDNNSDVNKSDIYIKFLSEKNINKYYGPATQHNYIKLRDELKNRNIRHVCVEYPTRDITYLKEMIGSDSNVIFVDNEKSFKDVVEKEGYDIYFIDKFAKDWGHCTGKGNKLLAQNIADAILKTLQKTIKQ